MKSTVKSEVKKRGRTAERAQTDFDYTKARPNRFANRVSAKSVVVLLDPDIAKVFKNAEAANSALRAILSAVPS